MKKYLVLTAAGILVAISAVGIYAKEDETPVTSRDKPKMREAYSYFVLEEKNPAFVANNEGNFYLIKGDHTRAVESYRKASILDPANTLILNNLAWALIVSGEYSGALDTLKKSVVLDPKNPSTHFYLGITYYQLSDLNNADRELETAVLLDPGHPYSHYYLSMVYASRGELEKALTEGEAAAFILGDIWNPDVALYLGDLYGRAGMFQKALLQYQKLVGDKDYAFRAQYGLGITYGAFGDMEKAEKHLLQALDLDNEDSLVYYALGKVYSQDNDKLKKALKYAEEALSMEPGNPRFLYLVGWIYYRLGERENALEYIRNASDADPENESYRSQIKMLEGDTP